MTWQPIETAPKDGSEVLLVSSFGICVSSWGKCVPQLDGYQANAGEECWRTKNKEKIVAGQITHWMPLPNLPSNVQPKTDVDALDDEYARLIKKDCHSMDFESGHYIADALLCELLTILGCNKTVEAFGSIKKLYA